MGRLSYRTDDGEWELTVDWTPFSKPEKIYTADDEIEFSYGAGHQRLTRIDREKVGSVFVNSAKKVYVSGWLEQTESWSGSAWETSFTRLYISSPTGTIGVINHDADATASPAYSKEWMHFDHLGSVVAITDTSDNFVERFSYDPWGQRRNPDDWSGAPSSAPSIASTDRGFTGHEMLDSLGLVHMNGRIYDAQLGVFLSPDPNVQFPDNLQSYNRYSYVLNNPLSYTDPSGYFLSGLKNFFKKWWKVIVTIVVVVVAAIYLGPWAASLVKDLGFVTTAGTLSSTGLAIAGGITGAIAGFAGGFVGSLLNGGSIGDAFSAGLMGALTGAITGAVAGWAGDALKGAKFWTQVKRAAAHGVAGGVVEEIRGGSFLTGFAASAFTVAVMHGIPGLSGFAEDHVFAGAAIAAVVGGTAAVIGGGKFENGAITSALQSLINQGGRRTLKPRDEKNQASWLQRKLQHAIVRAGGVNSALAHRLLEHYMLGSGDPYVLTAAEVAEVQGFLNGSNGPFDALDVDSVKILNKDGVLSVDVLAKAGSLANGTLGQFLIHYQGQITIDNGAFRFLGMMTYVDNYDFTLDNNAGRSNAGKTRTWYGRNFISGEEFPVSSVPIAVDIYSNNIH